MKRNTRIFTIWAMAALAVCSTCSTGCDPLNSINSLNIIIPLGLGGTPGLLNPFGIIQAMVNSALGTGTTTDGTTATFPVPEASTLPPSVIEPGTGIVIPVP
jgi:hypothetical protein